MRFVNAYVFDGEGFRFGGFDVEEGRFGAFLPDVKEGGEDLQGAYVLPGLVDVHTHGAAGADFSDGDEEGLIRMAAHLAGCGVTSFAPTSMTLPYETLEKAYRTAVKLSEKLPEGCARIAGIHMEGPFFSEKKKGAQNAAYLRLPDAEAVRHLREAAKGLLRIVDVAPELEGAAAFTKEVSRYCTVSVAHTDANYEETRAVYEAGATHLTHLYNAMPGIHHRSPGVIGAASERENVVAELIGDGLHVHPSAVRMAFKLFPGRICLISDSLRCCGMPDGEYELGGQQVFLKGGVARLEDGTIAGAASDLFADMRNVIAFGIPVAEAVRSATIIPAREIGRDDEIGSIEAGKLADFVVCTPELERKAVFIGGRRLG